MMFRSGSLDVTSEIRSVPLGQKRKKGRPKKIQHCLSKSPPMSALATLESDEETDTVEEVAEMNVSFEEAAVEDVVEDEVVDIGLKTRKRKHQGLGISKPPKKKPRLPVPIVQPSVPTSSSSAPRKQVRKKPASASCTTLAGPSSDPAPPPTSASTGSTDQPPAVSVKPVPRKCKKKLGVCNHEIVFGNHYDRKEWNIYANSVRLAKSVTPIDPDYLT